MILNGHYLTIENKKPKKGTKTKKRSKSTILKVTGSKKKGKKVSDATPGPDENGEYEVGSIYLQNFNVIEKL